MTHNRTRMLTLHFLTVAVFAALSSAHAQTYTYKVLHTFRGNNGENPVSRLLARAYAK